MAITKAMLARCQNEKMQAFCALDNDVQAAMKANSKYSQMLDDDSGKWDEVDHHFINCLGIAYRLSPDTPTEPEYEEFDVLPGPWRTVNSGQSRGGTWSLMYVTGHETFLGIIYRSADGTESLRTSVDAAFGTPVRVRFSK